MTTDADYFLRVATFEISTAFLDYYRAGLINVGRCSTTPKCSSRAMGRDLLYDLYYLPYAA